MTTYPSYPPVAVGSTRVVKNPSYRSASEGGYTFTRKKWTAPKSEYSLNYPSLNAEQFKILRDFFITNQGSSFKFKHPLESEIKICVFAMDELSITDNAGGFCSLKIDLIEV